MVLYIPFVTFEVDDDVPSFTKSVGYGMILFPAWMSQEFSKSLINGLYPTDKFCTYSGEITH